MESTKIERADVIIVGAGITGTTAAKILHEEGFNVIVLEAKDRVGGRVHTIKTSTSEYTNLGGEFIAPLDHKVIDLCEELGVEIYKPPPPAGCLAFHSQGRTVPYRTVFPIWNPIIWMDLNNFFRALKTESAKIPRTAPWNAKNAAQLDQMTAKEWIEKTCYTKTAKQVATALVSVTFCVEPGELSLLFLLWFRGNISRLYYDHFFCVPPTFQIDGQRLIGGTQQICKKMVAPFKSQVHLNSPVQEISQDGKKVTVKTQNGNFYEADYVICSVPIPMIQHIIFSPPLPSLQSQAYQRIPMGTCIKTITYYSKAFWQDKGLTGSCVVLDDDAPVNFIIDDTQPDGVCPALLSFITAAKARTLMSYTVKERKQTLHELYSRVFGSEEAKQPIDYIECDWSSEQYIEGGFASFYPPGVITNYARSVKSSYGRIHFSSGDNIRLLTCYCMNGAIAAGSQAARQVLYRSGRITGEDASQEGEEVNMFPEAVLTWKERAIPSVQSFLQMINFLILLCTLGGLYISCRKTQID
ncbi:amine oxidase [flavin-containing] A-like [Ptychodera flava]|uniref:amine oxidase [flavin-containing] A-like n=1 Tax=Ptychodera flava TaxID=63121 RepID=UPI00396A67F6